MLTNVLFFQDKLCRYVCEYNEYLHVNTVDVRTVRNVQMKTTKICLQMLVKYIALIKILVHVLR